MSSLQFCLDRAEDAALRAEKTGPGGRIPPKKYPALRRLLLGKRAHPGRPQIYDENWKKHLIGDVHDIQEALTERRGGLAASIAMACNWLTRHPGPYEGKSGPSLERRYRAAMAAKRLRQKTK